MARLGMVVLDGPICLQRSFPDARAWKESSLRIRMVSYPHLVQIGRGLVGDFSLLLSNNARTGTCFGDSGGPNFIGYTTASRVSHRSA